MTAWSQVRGGGLLAALVAKAESWLVEPGAMRSRPCDPEPGRRPVIAVVGLVPRCGTTTVARALAVELARRDSRGVAAVSAAAPPRAPMLATSSSRRLARSLAGDARAAGRLCLVPDVAPELRETAARRSAPLVIDVGHGVAPEAALALADRAVLVATPEVEPALAEVLSRSLARGPRGPVTVVNRTLGDERAWADRAAVTIAESRLGARLALAGREPVGPLADSISELADLCEAEA